MHFKQVAVRYDKKNSGRQVLDKQKNDLQAPIITLALYGADLENQLSNQLGGGWNQ
jgi:hypothetical protein